MRDEPKLLRNDRPLLRSERRQCSVDGAQLCCQSDLSRGGPRHGHGLETHDEQIRELPAFRLGEGRRRIGEGGKKLRERLPGRGGPHGQLQFEGT